MKSLIEVYRESTVAKDWLLHKPHSRNGTTYCQEKLEKRNNIKDRHPSGK